MTETSVIVSEFAGVWETPFTFSAKPRRVGILKWRRLPETALFNALAVLITWFENSAGKLTPGLAETPIVGCGPSVALPTRG